MKLTGFKQTDYKNDVFIYSFCLICTEFLLFEWKCVNYTNLMIINLSNESVLPIFMRMLCSQKLMSMLIKYFKVLILLFVLQLSSSVYAQNQVRIDSIKVALNRNPTAQNKIKLLNRLSIAYDDINVLQWEYAKDAERIAILNADAAGRAEALANQGFYFFGQLRNPSLAKTYFTNALACCKPERTSLLGARIRLRIGSYINQVDPSGAAKPYLLHAFETFHLVNDRNLEALTAKELALVFSISHQKDSAFLFLSIYGEYVRSLNNEFLKAGLYALTARLYGEFFNEDRKQTDYFNRAAAIYEDLLKKNKRQLPYLVAYAQLHACKSNIHWLKNQLSELKTNSRAVLTLCADAGKQTRNVQDLNQLRWAAYTSLIRCSIKEKDTANAEKYIKEGIHYFEKNKDDYHLGKLLWTIESSWWRYSEYFKAYEFQQKELETWDRVGNMYWKCIAMANTAMVFGRLGNYDRQINCIRQLLAVSKANQVNAFTLYANKDMAKSFYMLGRLDSASIYIKRAEQLNKENENPFITMVLFFIDGLINEKQGNYDEAIALMSRASDIRKQYAYPINTYDQVAPENALARIYLEKKDDANALKMALKSLDLSEKENMKDMLSSDYLTLAGIYKRKQDYAKLSFYLEKHIALKIDIAKEDAEKAIHKKEISTINKKNELERKLLLREKDLEKAQLKIQTIWSWFFTIAFIAICFFAYFLYKSYKIKIQDNILLSEQKAEIYEKNEELKQLNEEISTQRDNLYNLNEESRLQNEEISEQNKMIVRQQKDITSSIVYASRIQQAMIPSFEQLTNNFPDSFVLFLPRDIVSGDFYWVKQVRNQLYILAADCTGHGVPGAFMSMLGISLMNEMISSRHIDAPNIVLTELRKRVKRSLHQDDTMSDSKDGMDASLVLIDLDSLKLQFAGAYNPLYLVRKAGETFDDLNLDVFAFADHQMAVLSADRMPIGVHPNDDNPFTNKTMKLRKGDSIYLFSDGYVSQFGGEKGSKFKTKPFKELILSIQDKSMEDQQNILNSRLNEWRGESWEQVDDILVMGVRIS